MEEGEDWQIVPGSQGKSKTDYFRDKFRVSLKIEYGCQLDNVSSCGKERVKVAINEKMPFGC